MSRQSRQIDSFGMPQCIASDVPSAAAALSAALPTEYCTVLVLDCIVLVPEVMRYEKSASVGMAMVPFVLVTLPGRT